MPLKILITGATGFVGRQLVQRLSPMVPADSEIYTSGLSANLDDRDHHLRFDIADNEAVTAAMEMIKPTCVIHLAAITTLEEARQNSRRAWDTNLRGSIHLAEALFKQRPDARFIFASTSETYGAAFNRGSDPIDETAALQPISVYGATKAATEIMLGQMAYQGMDVVRVRAFNHTGPGQSNRFVVPAFAAQIAAIGRGDQAPVLKVGNLEAQRDFVDVRDVVEAYCMLTFSERLPTATVLNISSGQPRKISDILKQIMSIAGVEATIEVDQSRMRPADVPLAVGNPALADRLVGWRPRISWDTTLRDVLAEQRQALD